MKAILLISHGSHSPEAKEEVSLLLDKLKKKNHGEVFEYAFLEIESPSIPEGIQSCVEKGAKEIVILLNFLNSGRHVNQDVPRIISEAKVKYPHVSFVLTLPVGQHPNIIDLFLDLIK